MSHTTFSEQNYPWVSLLYISKNIRHFHLLKLQQKWNVRHYSTFILETVIRNCVYNHKITRSNTRAALETILSACKCTYCYYSSFMLAMKQTYLQDKITYPISCYIVILDLPHWLYRQIHHVQWANIFWLFLLYKIKPSVRRSQQNGCWS